MDIEIYYDAEQEIEWFISLDPRLASAKRELLRARGKNKNKIVEDLIMYDRPDIILLVNNKPKLVLEKTEEVPSGHNVGQRIGRLARAVEMGVSIVKFFPFLAMKHGKNANKCYVRPNIFLAFERMKQLHGVHVLAINWICDDDFELVRNGTENIMIKNLMKAFIDNKFSFNEIKEVEYAEKLMEKECNLRMSAHLNYRRLAPSLAIIKTNELLSQLQSKFGCFNFEEKISKREETLIYKIGMTPENCRREDPYTGNQFIYDYRYCRNGPLTSDRTTNFVLKFPLLSKAEWKEANPFNPGRKSYLWYVLADFMIFSDGILSRGDNFEQ